ncbi:MAG: PhzF family phenazine biosynthesis protein [Synergistaceae bacterium]|jgi:PhzF family phenazine biosynthesis protein|nr:PhzF family phenazine biosynthesis protein [Synergistaceae bacterium]
MRYYAVDAFTEELFKGNPAGVCVPEEPLAEELMQKIAAENNLSETAFVVRNGSRYDLRWFTPLKEIELCGHATLATTCVLSTFYDRTAENFEFSTLSGILKVQRRGDLYEMDFPVRPVSKISVSEAMKAAVGVPIRSAWSGYSLLLELNDEKAVRDLKPDMAAVKRLEDWHALIVTAVGESCDFVSRFFAPNFGVDEDPVTGSSHTTLIPFWAERLGKQEMTARQLSRRGGVLHCKNAGSRVLIAGKAVLYMKGEITLP